MAVELQPGCRLFFKEIVYAKSWSESEWIVGEVCNANLLVPQLVRHLLSTKTINQGLIHSYSNDGEGLV